MEYEKSISSYLLSRTDMHQSKVFLQHSNFFQNHSFEVSKHSISTAMVSLTVKGFSKQTYKTYKL